MPRKSSGMPERFLTNREWLLPGVTNRAGVFFCLIVQYICKTRKKQGRKIGRTRCLASRNVV